MKHTLICLLLILAAVFLIGCSKSRSYRTIQTHYADCEIVEDYKDNYRYFIRKPDGTIVSVKYQGIDEEVAKQDLEHTEILIFKPKL